MRISCLSLSGIPLPASVNDVLYRTAREMLRERIRRKQIDAPNVAGLVSTAWEYGTLDGAPGIYFSAGIRLPALNTSVEYLVTTSGLNEPDRPVVWRAVVPARDDGSPSSTTQTVR